MTDEQLREIEERANAATPGPWHAGYWSGQCHMKHKHDPRICQYDYTLQTRKGDSFIGVVNDERETVVGVSYDDLVVSEADNQFIAHAREDIPALIAEIRRLSLYEQEFREAVQASTDLFQGADAPYNHLLLPGDNITVKGWAALDGEIRRLKGQAVNSTLRILHLGSGLAKWSQSFQPPDGIDPERE